jgi:hypothetical protein
MKRKRKEAKEIEMWVWQPRREMTDKEVLDKVEDWVEDPFYSKMRETEYFKSVETCWIVKAIAGQTLHMTKREQSNLLHAIHILEGKFELFCRS